MAENNYSCVNGVISAFFTGALVGAGLALIFAPVTGKDARQTLVNQYKELKEKIKELEKKLKEDSLRYIILAKEPPKKTPEISRRPRRIITGAKPKVKMELKEIDKKLEEILEEN